MIAIATGFDALDKKIEEIFRARGINDIQIVNYREFLIQQSFDTVIMSKNLVGQIELEYLVLSLRERNSRIIYLTNEKDLRELKTCLDFGIYDLIFDPISPETVVNVYNRPKTFADVKQIFMIVNSPDNKQKAKELDRYIKSQNMAGSMQGMSSSSNLVQNRAEAYDTGKNKQEVKRDNKVEQRPNNSQMPNGQVMPGGYQMNPTSYAPSSMQDTRNTQMPHMQASEESMPNQNVGYQGQMPQMEKPMPQMERPVQDNTSNQKELRPLSDLDFHDDKKRVIRETQIETSYQIPNDYKKTIVIMSPESCGKTTLAVNMAWYYAKKGIKTTLIDTDLHKKDIYYNFPIDTAECLSKVSQTEDVTRLGISVDRNLKVYTEHKDIQVSLELYDLVKLITASKRISQVVIVDLDYTLDQEMIKNVLEIADNILVVVDQKVTTLNRVPEELYAYRNQLQTIDLVVNRFYNIRHLEKERVADFFRSIEIYNGKTFDIKINKVFTVSDDAKSVLQGLAERTPSIEIRDNILDEDIKILCDSYYMGENKKKGFRF